MKAVLLDKPGPPSSLRIGEISIPRPGVDEALVRVCATSLNPVDYKVAARRYDGWRYPHVLGVDVAGVIETIGEGVLSWNRGDQVFYHTTWRKDGSYAEFNVAPAHTFARIPEGISFVEAATLPCAALTAYCALYRRLHVREGDIVLVHAAAGGVGGFAVQLAKAAKAFVIGTCSASNAKYVRELGADEVINYRSEDVFQRARAIAGDRGIDVIIDNIGPGNGVDNLGLLGPEGRLACIAGIPDLSVVPRSSLFDLNSRYRFGRSYGLAGLSAAARGFGSNGDRVDGAGTGREDQTDRGGTNYNGSNSERIGTTGRGARPR